MDLIAHVREAEKNQQSPAESGLSKSFSLMGASTSSSFGPSSFTSNDLPHDFLGITNFFFSTSVTVIPNATYYLQPVAQFDSDGFGSYVTDGSYTGGSAISQGIPIISRNLWFQEGIVVPEPSSALVLVFGGSLLVWTRRKKHFK